MDHGATEDAEAEETGESFGFIYEQKDLDYWLGSNVPVVLFVARLSDELIYWKPVHSWFTDPERRRTRKVIFDKSKDVLNEAALPGLAATVASFATPGRIVPSTRSAETLNSNLLKASFPDRIHEFFGEYVKASTIKARAGDWVLNGEFQNWRASRRGGGWALSFRAAQVLGRRCAEEDN